MTEKRLTASQMVEVIASKEISKVDYKAVSAVGVEVERIYFTDGSSASVCGIGDEAIIESIDNPDGSSVWGRE